ANARWSDTIAVNTTLYATTTGNCGGAPNAVWAIDLESEDKPVVSWKSNGGRRRQGECDRRARSQDPAGEGLVFASRRRIRHRPGSVQAQRSGDRRGRDKRRTSASPGRGFPR